MTHPGLSARAAVAVLPVGDPAVPVSPLVRPLRQETLGLHGEQLTVPTYDRAALVPSVVHFSVGGFHRAHQLLYFDELAERGVTDWGVVGIGLHTRGLKDALAPQ